MNFYKPNGSLDIICGSMFSGKTEELIRRMRRAIYGQKKVQVFKHNFDNRYLATFINSHNGEKLQAISASNVNEIIECIAPETEIIGIDEIQFFGKEIILAVDTLVKNGKKVIAAGLDLDFRGLPFGAMPYLLALADNVTKLKAVCVKTGKDAHFSQRIVNGRPARHNDEIILVGATECYEARSRDSFEIDKIPLEKYLENK
jgi:thymidine kinase